MMRYENKTNDLIWLELQAWFAGMDPEVYDRRLVEMRECVEDTIKQVLKFEFESLEEEEEEKLDDTLEDKGDFRRTLRGGQRYILGWSRRCQFG